MCDSRSAASGCVATIRGLLLPIVALLTFGSAFTVTLADVRVGTYVGNGTSQSIGGLPWSPDAVIVKGENSKIAVMRSASMSGDQSKLLVGATALTAGLITSLDAFGFSVGSNDSVNAAATTYHWVAFAIEPSMMFTGSYLGNGSTDRVIGDPGFPCNHTILMSAGGHKAVHSTPTSNRSYDFEKNEYFDAITTPLPPNGFRVGDNDSANKSGETYHYVCWQRVFGRQWFASWFGDGSDDRERIIGFRPEYVFVNSITASKDPTQRFRTIPDTTDQSLYFKSAGTVTNHIQKILSNGIEVGNDTEVNQSGEGYAYFAWGPPGIGGRVFEDADFSGTATDWDGGAADRALANVDLELYDATDTLVMSTTTDALGRYFFGGMASGTYKIRVRSATLGDADTPPKGTLNACVPAICPYPLPEMTWGAGAPLYGGQDPEVDDTAAAAPGDTWASVAFSGTDVTDAHFGFAYNLIVNTADDALADNVRSKQGSLRQFIKNANAIGTAGGTTANSSEFRIPTSDTNYDSGSGVFTITAATDLSAITDADTTIDATTQTTNVGDTNALALGTGGTVGVDGLALDQVAGPEVEIRDTGALTNGILIQADDATVRGLAILGFGTGDDEAAIRVEAGTDGALIEANVLGTSASSFSDPGAALRSYEGIDCDGATGGTIRNNLIGFTARRGIFLHDLSTGWTVEDNEIRDNGLANADGDGIAVDQSTGGFTGNLIAGSSSQGLVVTNAAGNSFTNNTVTGNGVGTPSALVQSAGITMRSTAGATVLDRNVVEANYGAGIQVNNGAIGTKLTRNSFADNGTIVARNGDPPTGQVGIDLNSPTDDNNFGTAPFYTLNDSGDGDSGGNTLLNFPVLDTAQISGGNLELTGWARPGAVIEVFVAAADPSGFGEGQTYKVTLTEGGTGAGGEDPYADLDATTSSYGPGPVNGIVQGQDTTNRFRFVFPTPAGVDSGTQLTATGRDGSDNTSEFSGLVTAAPPLSIVKRAFENDGTPIASGSTLPKGVPFKFMLYIDNPGGAVADVSLQDVLDPAFAYQAGTMKMDNTLVSSVVCPGGVCDEAAIFSQVDGSGVSLGDGDSVTPPIDADEGSYNGGTRTIDVGDQNNVNNSQLNVAMDRVWALVFNIRMQ